MYSKLLPQYIAGFVDGEGSFHIAIYKDPKMKTGFKIIPEFHVSQRYSSKIVLEKIKEYLDCGYIKANHAKNCKDNTFVLVIRNKEDLKKKVIPFFQKYKLQTEKAKDFILFSKVIRLMANQAHRDNKKIAEIFKIAYSMNGQGRYRQKKYRIHKNPQRLHVRPALGGKI